jgi:uncharacterized protein YndB with AHSA1/START domain
MSETTFKPEGKTLLVERVFSAPKERVWNAWTTPEEFEKWWGPRGWETTVKEMEFSEGGRLLYCMKCMDKNQTDWFGKESCGVSTYLEIDKPNGFTYKDEFSDNKGNIDATMPAMIIKMRFEETDDGKTKVSSFTEFASEADVKKVVEMGMEEGLKQTWDRLEELFESPAQ